jgi:hypothetical protein
MNQHDDMAAQSDETREEEFERMIKAVMAQRGVDAGEYLDSIAAPACEQLGKLREELWAYWFRPNSLSDQLHAAAQGSPEARVLQSRVDAIEDAQEALMFAQNALAYAEDPSGRRVLGKGPFGRNWYEADIPFDRGARRTP